VARRSTAAGGCVARTPLPPVCVPSSGMPTRETQRCEGTPGSAMRDPHLGGVGGGEGEAAGAAAAGCGCGWEGSAAAPVAVTGPREYGACGSHAYDDTAAARGEQNGLTTPPWNAWRGDDAAAEGAGPGASGRGCNMPPWPARASPHAETFSALASRVLMSPRIRA
jgi:hypothetical protein